MKKTEGLKFSEEIAKRLESELQGILDRETILAASEARKLNSPHIKDKTGKIKGFWQDDCFILKDDYIPNNHNDERYSVAQIKKILYKKYKIRFEGIRYVNGVADFSPISVANVSTEDVLKIAGKISDAEYDRLDQTAKIELMRGVFSDAADGKDKREINFEIVDKIAAEKKIRIPTLGKNYTADQLGEWRKKNKFSWDEQLQGGYNLVPNIIHSNYSHTGLVSISKQAYKNLQTRYYHQLFSPEDFCVDEDEAIISVRELEEKNAQSTESKPNKKSRNRGKKTKSESNEGKIDSLSSDLEQKKETYKLDVNAKNADDSQENIDMSSYDEIKNSRNPYENDKGYYSNALIKSRTGSNVKYNPSLIEQYSERMQGLYAEIDGRELTPEEHDEYLNKVYDLQDELGYYPEFDPRMEGAYSQVMSPAVEVAQKTYENGDVEQLKKVREAYVKYDAVQRDRLGYYPNRPGEHVHAEIETMDEYANEAGSESVTNVEETENMENYANSETYSANGLDSEANNETMDEYAGVEGQGQSSDEQESVSHDNDLNRDI